MRRKKKMQEQQKKIKQFIESLNIPFKSIDIYVDAFTHRSYINDHKSDKTLTHNERLEFLGDAVLELVISEYLFSEYKNRPEGELTSFRAATVKTESLAETAKQLGYGQYLLMSKGEEATGGREKDYLLANTYEAILGAIYLDCGYNTVKQFIQTTLVPKIENIVNLRLDIDAKTKFQEIAQEQFKITPTYQTISETGPDHDKVFVMAVKVGKEEFGRGEGASKQKAEERAATNALEKISKGS